jgi:hypothetical protein
MWERDELEYVSAQRHIRGRAGVSTSCAINGRHVSNHRADNDKLVDISALKKRRLPREPALFLIGCFLDLVNTWGPSIRGITRLKN